MSLSAIIKRAIEDVAGKPSEAPPPKGVQIHGFDGTYARRIRTDVDGYLLIKPV